ncbi:hypothetical protein HYH02_009467 [Chlamydomonas schloesseri]|uniref:Uncharacterized protein n=1 Tax=Chlamydomonas schloesseri TaxID=2026947 RepID=A0A835W752_9CHLO|nr:hypothetical protein HYH02_009467 [Chlamydomonas schloesseri]|eukprot:KAG2443052.1 hypothetical protein HYH02_009467 [Chlamydomonas schloesseri]
MSGKSKSREMLEVPAVNPMERKLANLTRERPAIGPAPRSAMLDQLAAFLPQLAKENEKLEQQLQSRPAAEFDIEAVDEKAEGPYIEMDLACGVLELRDDAALAAAERAMQGQGGFELGVDGAAEGSGDSSSDDDDSDDDSDEDDSDGEEAAEAGAGAAGAGRRHGSGAAGGRGRQGGGARRGGGLQEASESEPMECEEEEEEEGDGEQPQDALRGQREVAGGKAAAAGPGRPARGGLVGGRRRKVAAKRSKMIEEL